jgi:hypothetical protein
MRIPMPTPGRGQQHHAQAPGHGAPAVGIGLLRGLRAALGDGGLELAQQLGGFAVDAAHRHVTHRGLQPGGLELLQAVAVAGGHLGAGRRRRRPTGPAPDPQIRLQALGQGVDLLLFLEEGIPVLVQQLAVRAAQQGVLPFLHLGLEMAFHGRGAPLLIHLRLHVRVEDANGPVGGPQAGKAGQQGQQQGETKGQRQLSTQIHGELLGLKWRRMSTSSAYEWPYAASDGWPA